STVGNGVVFKGYEIHLGETLLLEGTAPLFKLKRLDDTECRVDGTINDTGSIIGTYLHGLFDCADGVALLVRHWQKLCGKELSEKVNLIDPAREREQRYDKLAEHYRNGLNMDLIYRALDGPR
ncbi:MAG: hypothetical protein ACRD8U_08345, partial [Pyrinomonadaceae bacterium]